jgi:enterochelin esterase-like enzyme
VGGFSRAARKLFCTVMNALPLALPQTRPHPLPRARSRRLLLQAPLLALAAPAMPATPAAHHAHGGRLVELGEVTSAHLRPRRVTVWLPPGYSARGAAHAVLYMHDGQNLFDPATSYTGVPWAVDRHLAALVPAQAVRPTVVVGIWNTPDRRLEYVPAAPLRQLPPALQQAAVAGGGGIAAGLMADAYLRFIVEELKPAIDRRFRTAPGMQDTALMGSSMGGLISLYGLCRHPGVFGAAGCLSTHWPMTGHPRLIEQPHAADAQAVAASLRDWLRENLPAPGRHRLYFDHGDQGLEALYAPHQQRVDALLAARGWRAGTDFMSRTFPGTDHSERAWQARLDVPLRFLLPA